MELEKYLSDEVICLDLGVAKKDAAIRKLVDLLCDARGLGHRETILDTVFVREKEKSTGIGYGVAIPHARTDIVGQIFLAMGRHKEGMDWGAMDGKPTQFIFLVVGPAKASEDYLRVLADISRLIKRADVRASLLEATTSAKVLAIIRDTKPRENRV